MSNIYKKRRSIFPAQYNENEVSKEEILELLETANWAPSHRKTEPWRFKIFRGDSLRKLGEFLGEKYKEIDPKPSNFKYNKIVNKPQQSSAIIGIFMQRDPKESVPEWEEIAAVAMAVQNLWLKATEMHIGGYWSSPKLIDYMGEHITLNEGEKCLGFFYLGKYDEHPEGIRESSVMDKTEWI